MLCLNGSDCLLWKPWEDRKPRVGDGEEHKKKFYTFKGLGEAPCSAGSSCRALWKCQSWDTHGATAIIRLEQGKNGNFSEASSKLMGQRASAQLQAVLSINLPALGWILTFMNIPFTSEQVCSKALLHKVKLKIPNTRHWNDCLDGPKQIFEQPEAL